MATNTVSIEVGETTAQIVQALTAKAQGVGKSTEDLLREVRSTGHLLMLGFNGSDVVLTEGTPDEVYETIKAERLQKEKAKLRQMLLDGINSGEPTEVTDQTWKEMRAEVVKRVNERKGNEPK